MQNIFSSNFNYLVILFQYAVHYWDNFIHFKCCFGLWVLLLRVFSPFFVFIVMMVVICNDSFYTQLRVNTGFTEDKCGLSPSMPAIAFSSSRPSSLRLLSVSCFLEKDRAITAQSQVQTGKTSWIVITFN